MYEIPSRPAGGLLPLPPFAQSRGGSLRAPALTSDEHDPTLFMVMEVPREVCKHEIRVPQIAPPMEGMTPAQDVPFTAKMGHGQSGTLCPPLWNGTWFGSVLTN